MSIYLGEFSFTANNRRAGINIWASQFYISGIHVSGLKPWVFLRVPVSSSFGEKICSYLLNIFIITVVLLTNHRLKKVVCKFEDIAQEVHFQQQPVFEGHNFPGKARFPDKW